MHFSYVNHTNSLYGGGKRLFSGRLFEVWRRSAAVTRLATGARLRFDSTSSFSSESVLGVEG